MHEAAVHDGFVFGYNLVAVAAFQSFLVLVALMIAVLHLLEIPNDTEFADTCNQMPFLLTIFGDLEGVA